MRAHLAVPFAAVLAGAAVLAQNVAAPERFAGARAKILAEIEGGHAPSIAVAVLEAGEVVWAEGFGMIDLETRRPASADSIYRLASISKTFTATAIMQLVERGLVDLDAPINRYLDVPLRAYRGTADQVTVRRLANHTGGLPTHWNFFYTGETPPPRAESIRQFGFVASVPGTKTTYSNFAFGILDHVIARIGKNPGGYRGWLVDELCDPLGLTHTDVGVRPGAEEHAAVGYRKEGDGWVAIPDYGFDHDGASAVRSSANDLMRFARLQLERGTVEGVRVLDAESVLAMREQRGRDAGSSFGIGWSVGTVRGAAVLRHSGGMPGVSTQLLVFPELGIAIAVLTNGGNRGATNRALDAILDVLPGPPPTAGPAMQSAQQADRLTVGGQWRGVLSHPDGPLAVDFEIRRDGEVTTRPRIGDGPRHTARVTGTPDGIRVDCRYPLTTFHEGDAEPRLTFELASTATGYAGVCAAEVANVCRVPFWCELHAEQPKPGDTLRVVTYNVLVGFHDSEVGRFLPGCQRETKVAAFLAAQQPDVVALQEMNGFNEDRLRKLAATWGHEHVALLKPDGYPVAITSSAPLTNITRLRDDLHHGMLRATTHGTDFIVVHLKPHPGVDYKLAECRQALALYREALDAGRQAIVLGDFNSISPADAARFSPAARERYEKWKYLVTADRPAEIAMTPLLEAGAVDVFLTAGKPPTALPLPRIDFVLASPDLAARASAARWLCTAETLQWSDHPPVVADFQVGPATRK
ncbi:MAG: serine hydrolase [Planctomycetes bacterium]|nr:serine hydrolase [Planctomycetota bacterium]